MAVNSTRKKRRMRWTTEEEEALVKLWDIKYPKLRGQKRNAHIYAEIAAEMVGRNMQFDSHEVKFKMHNLTNRFKKEKDKMETSGGSRSDWPYFDRINAIIGNSNVQDMDSEIEESAVYKSENSSIYPITLISVPSSTPMSSPLTPLTPTPLPSPTSIPQSPLPPELERESAKKSELSLLQSIETTNKDILNEIRAMRHNQEQSNKAQEEMLQLERQRNEIMIKMLTCIQDRKKK
ncbi:uncharacterized protein LOC119682468 [Teleopsis dalmanni]|uniref:uncharacterized protein LOC119682468 n=1 Tax=Teleopsis dalmanni TaxID=139649 RepID=UPI0018CD476E|nr:uncharacterized protein LOC119682468 [Teleopsis dalmanni]